MTMATPRQALAATRQWLKPVIFILLKCGVTWREFSELSKSVYVEIATRRFGKRGWPTNVRHTRAGVPEVWLLNPRARNVTIHQLSEGAYTQPRVLKRQGRTPLAVAPEVVIDLDAVAAEIG